MPSKRAAYSDGNASVTPASLLAPAVPRVVDFSLPSPLKRVAAFVEGATAVTTTGLSYPNPESASIFVATGARSGT